ncbi:MAG: hypothetical protein Q8Q11_03260, partial [bacterium]|nr:hypothetical protein [bacterium]
MSKRTTLKRLLKTGLVVLVLTASLAASLATAPRAEAISAAEVNGLQDLEGARDLFKIDGNDAPKFAWQPDPPPKNPTDAKGKDVAVFVCEQTVSSCSSGTPGAVRFRLTGIDHEDRGTGLDNWDFVFKPYRGDTPIQTQLQIVYRVNTDGAKVAALVWGDPGDESLPENVVGQLNGFSSTAFAEDFLHKLQNDAGLQWAKKQGIQTSTNQTSLTDRASTDPFSMALEKLAEIITSLIGSVSSAVEWAIDAGALMNNEGLAKAWTVVRDLVNVLFVVVLLALSIMTIIRVEPQKYNVRQLLPLLVFSVLAVNFSFLFAGILANTAAVLSQPFLEQAVSFIKETAGVGAGYADGLVDGFGEAVVLLIASIVILVALLILLFFLVVRIIVVWVLAVLSPVVFLFLVLPLTRGEARNLLKTYIQWVYMAPIAMLLLFTGSLMLNSALRGTDTGDPGGSAILQAIFFAGITIAAVMVPIGMGGRIAKLAGGQGSKWGKRGGKGGLGAIGLIPTGGGRTVGQRVREGKAFMDQRKKNLEQRAGLSAANAQLQLAQGPLGSTLTGMDDSIRTSVQDKLIGEKEKEIAAHDITSKRKMVHAWQYGVGQDANGAAYALDNKGGNAGYLTPEEERLSQDRIVAGAAYKSIAANDLSERYMLEQPGIGGRTLAWTGAQQHHRGNPIISSYGLDGKLNVGSMKVKSHHMDSDRVKGLDTDFLRGASEGDRHALASLREIDEVRLANASNADHRMKFSTADKMHVMNDIVTDNLLSNSVERNEFEAGTKGDADFQ